MKKLKNILGVLILIGSFSCDKDDNTIVEQESVSPGDAILISPVKNQSCEEGIDISDDLSEITFEWNTSENTEFYDLIIIDAETGSEVAFYNNLQATTKKVDLAKDKSYTWKVISKNSQTTDTGMSESWNFFLVGNPQSNYAPFPADIISPAPSSSVNLDNGVFILEWSGADPDGDELRYTVYLDKVDGEQEPGENLRDLAEMTVEVQLEENETYYWRIKSSDGKNSSYSQIHYFKT